MAEGVMRKYFDLHGIEGRLDSAGTADWNVGSIPDRRAMKVSSKNSIDISNHRARQFHLNDCDSFDLIFALDRDVLKTLKKIVAPKHQHKIRLLLNNADIPDPYHADEETFHRTFEVIDECCRSFVENELKE